MKQLILGMLFWLCFFQVHAENNKATISGTILNGTGKEVRLQMTLNVPGSAAQLHRLRLDQTNTFQLNINLDQPLFGRLNFNNQLVLFYLEPGQHLEFSADGNNFLPSITYSGNNEAAANNTFLLHMNRTFGQRGTEFQQFYKEKNHVEFTGIMDQFLKDQLTELEKFRSSFSDAFARDILAMIEFGYAEQLLVYPYHHSRQNQKPELDTYPDNYYSFMKEIQPDNETTHIVNYPEFLRFYVYTAYERKRRKDPSFQENIISFADSILTGRSLAMFKTVQFETEINAGNLIYFENAMKAFIESNEFPEFTESLVAMLRTSGGIQKYMPAPGFSFPDLEGNEVSLSDLKGKVIYLDIWASWCGPCIAMVPYARKLKEAFKDEDDLVFLYVSIDDHEDRWRKMIENQKMEGIHLWSPGGWRSEITQLYQVSSIPRYLIIDKNGNIHAPQAKRPSDPELEMELRRLLDQ